MANQRPERSGRGFILQLHPLPFPSRSLRVLDMMSADVVCHPPTRSERTRDHSKVTLSMSDTLTTVSCASLGIGSLVLGAAAIGPVGSDCLACGGGRGWCPDHADRRAQTAAVDSTATRERRCALSSNFNFGREDRSSFAERERDQCLHGSGSPVADAAT